MCVATQLSDPEEFNDILEDVREEAGDFGTLKRIVSMQRPGDAVPTDRNANDSLPLFLEFADADSAAKCLQALKGRKFDGRVVGAEFTNSSEFPEHGAENASGADTEGEVASKLAPTADASAVAVNGAGPSASQALSADLD